MRIAGWKAAALVPMLLAGQSAAGEIKGQSTYYWTFKPTSLAWDEAQAYNLGQAKGLSVPATGDTLAVECSGWGAPDGRAAGSCVNYVAGGDRFWIEYECSKVVSPTPPGAIFACDGTAEAKGGTGEFAAIAGTNTHRQVIVSAFPDGTLVGYTTIESNYTY